MSRDSYELVEEELKIGQVVHKAPAIIPSSMVHGRIVRTRIVGCTFEARQENIAKLHESDRLWLERQAENKFDANAIRVVRNNGEELGFLNRFLAQSIAPYMDAIGHPLRARVLFLTGSSFGGFSLGAVIQFKIPSQEQLRRAQRLIVNLDWED